jgi:hypothetical protein
MTEKLGALENEKKLNKCLQAWMLYLPVDIFKLHNYLILSTTVMSQILF